MKITQNTDKAFIKAFNKFYKDFNIEGCSDIYRAKVTNNIKVGDIFNIYRGESRKEGCTWKGTLESSLLAHIGEGFKMNTTELIINKAMNICKADFMQYPDYDEDIELTLADALTIIVTHDENEIDSAEVYDLINMEMNSVNI